MRVSRACGLAFAAVVLAVSGCSAADAGDNLIYTEPGDPAIVAAEQAAVKALPVFWAKFDARDPGVTNYFVKVRLHVKDGGDEVIWAAPLERSAEEVVVRIANEPVYVADLKFGSVISVPPSDIVDWSYDKGGKSYGHFVSRAMMERAQPEERAEMQAMLAPTPLESDVR